MSPLDTLTILIEADARGLTTQLATATKKIADFVDDMNAKQIDWTSILSKTISPAIITGIAAMFANAIIQYVQFNQAATNLNNVSSTSTDALTGSINDMGGSIYSLAETAGSSLGDTTAAYEAFTKAGLDSAAATAATTDAAGIARDTGESMTDVVSELVNLFQQWGVTTTPQVTEALTGLANAAGNGKFTFDQLTAAIAQQGPLLQGKSNISDLAIQLAALSNQSGLTTTTILDTFNAVSQGVASPISNMNILFNGASKSISDGPDGLITAFTKIETATQGYGPAAVSMGQQVGLAVGDVSNLTTALGKVPDGMNKAATAADQLRTHLIPLDTLLQTDEPTVGKLSASWNNFVTALASVTVPTGIKDLEDTLNTLTGLINGFTGKSFSGVSIPGFTGIANSLSGFAVGALAGSPLGPLGMIGGGLAGLFAGPSVLGGTESGLLNLLFPGMSSSLSALLNNGGNYPNTNSETNTSKSATVNNTININNTAPGAAATTAAAFIQQSMNSSYFGT